MSKNKFNFDFIGKSGLFAGLSLILVLVSALVLVIKGIKYGIDFQGGTEIQVQFQQPVAIDQLRDSLASLRLGEVGVQSFGETNEFVIRFQGKVGADDKETNKNLVTDLDKIKNQITDKFSASGPEIRRVDTVGPQVGAELKKSGILSVIYSLLVILIYIGLRFDYKYAPGAVLCLAHDVIITLGIFVLANKEVNVPILAAILTLIGYSLNDTIVVFDRIRETENDIDNKGIGIAKVINKAINETLARTVITSGTTFVSALALAIFAGGTVADIAFALCIGIGFGTYSSIFVAAPSIMLIEKLNGKSAKA